MGKKIEFLANRLAGRAVNQATKGDKLADPKTIEKRCNMMLAILNAHPLYRTKGQGEAKLRNSLLSDGGLPKDIRKLRKKTDWSDSDIVSFYWQVPKFVELWTDVLGMDRDNFVFLVEVMSRDKDWEKKQIASAEYHDSQAYSFRKGE